MSESDTGSVTTGHRDDVTDLETFVQKLIQRLSQYVVQSRQGMLTKAKSDPNATRQVWFSVAVKELSEITAECSRALNSLNRNQQPRCSPRSGLPDNMIQNPLLCYFPFSIEISLRTAEGDAMVLEHWVLSLKDPPDPICRQPARFNSNDVYYRLGVMIKSVLIISRALPAYKLSRRQGPETFVVMYRPFLGECCSTAAVLGEGFQSCQVSAISTPAGTICLRVDYRTSMTIAPGIGGSCSSGAAAPYFISATGSAGSGGDTASNTSNSASGTAATGSQPIMMKSDHFHFAQGKPRYGDESSEHTVTSDDSASIDAAPMRLFVASPPHSLKSNASGAALMEEHLRRKQSGDGDSDSLCEKLKVGAFASRTAAGSAGEGDSAAAAESTDQLLQLFSRRSEPEDSLEKEDKEEEEQSSKEDLETALEKLEVTEDTAGATSVTSNRSASNKSEFEFVDNFKTPFSLRGQTPVSGRPVMMQPGAEASVTATKDLSDFFEETRRAKDLPVLLGANENVERAPSMPRSEVASATSTTASDPNVASGGSGVLEAQLDSLDEQLRSFESKFAEYDEMLKTLETASESESDYCVS